MRKKTDLELAGGVEQIIASNEPRATQTARLFQAVGQGMLRNPRLTEVEKGIFSSCPEPLGELGERILRARRVGIPLVEVTTMSDESADGPLRKLFDIPTGKLALSIVRADGYERPAAGTASNRVAIERASLVIPYGDPTVTDSATYANVIETRLTRGDYRDYDDTRSLDVLGRPREAGFYVPLFMYESRGYDEDIRAALGRVMADFRVASLCEGVVDGSVAAPEI